MAKISYAANGKRDIHLIEERFDSYMIKLASDTWQFEKNKKTILEYIRLSKNGMIKSNKVNRRIGKSTLYVIVGHFKRLSEKWLKKNFDETTQQDWDDFYNQMEENSFGKYSQATKSKVYKIIRKFHRWQENPEFSENWVVAEGTKTKEYLTRNEVERMVNGATALKVKTAIMTLFDGGFRIEEFLNLRWKDLTKKEGGYYQAHIRAETSKTKKERFVNLQLANDYLDSLKNSQIGAEKESFSEDNFIFKTGYNKIYTTLNRIGKKILNKRVNPHMFRHSSATYFSNVLKTYPQFCARYGWQLNSQTPQRYWHSVESGEMAEQTKDHEIARFKTEFEKTKLINEGLRSELEGIKSEISKLKNAEIRKDLSKYKTLDMEKEINRRKIKYHM